MSGYILHDGWLEWALNAEIEQYRRDVQFALMMGLPAPPKPIFATLPEDETAHVSAHADPEPQE